MDGLNFMARSSSLQWYKLYLYIDEGRVVWEEYMPLLKKE
jgi:hypothetical protein